MRRGRRSLQRLARLAEGSRGSCSLGRLSHDPPGPDGAPPLACPMVARQLRTPVGGSRLLRCQGRRMVAVGNRLVDRFGMVHCGLPRPGERHEAALLLHGRRPGRRGPGRQGAKAEGGRQGRRLSPVVAMSHAPRPARLVRADSGPSQARGRAEPFVAVRRDARYADEHSVLREGSRGRLSGPSVSHHAAHAVAIRIGLRGRVRRHRERGLRLGRRAWRPLPGRLLLPRRRLRGSARVGRDHRNVQRSEQSAARGQDGSDHVLARVRRGQLKLF